MRKIGFAFLLSFILSGVMVAQSIAVKTNLLYDAATTPNLAAEVALNNHFTLELSGALNHWAFPDNKSLQHWKAQPEVKYWFLEKFFGHYVGFYAQYLDYDIRNINSLFDFLKERRYDGVGYGGGISYGYQLYLSPRWNLEFTIGAGYVYFEYDKYKYIEEATAEYTGRYRTNYFGLNRLGISVVYIIK